MSTTPTRPDLLPGDLLCYRGTGFFSRLIRIKSWSELSHVECYFGCNVSGASRDGEGVGSYPLRLDGLYYVLRPVPPVDLAAARLWHETVKGQRYDWKGILVFTLAVKQGATDKMFCSEYATRFYRAGRCEPFQPGFDADRVAPGTFLTSGAFRIVWAHPEARYQAELREAV